MAGHEPSRSALAVLSAAEKAAVLDALLEGRPELREAAEQLAARNLRTVDRPSVAEEVRWSLQSVDAEAVFDRSGRQPDGYVEPVEAAWEVLEEELQPHLAHVKRLAQLGMDTAALEEGIGILLGLYECRAYADEDSALAWAPDFALEAAGEVLRELRGVGAEVPADVLEDLFPDWAGRLR